MRTKLFIVTILIISVILVILYVQTKTPIENKKSSDSIKKIGENWWKNIFMGNWDVLFNNTVDENSNKISYECQSGVRISYMGFVGNTSALKIEDTEILCTDVKDSSLPTPSSQCTAIKYSLTNKLGNFTGYLFFIKVENEWKVQINCNLYKKGLVIR